MDSVDKASTQISDYVAASQHSKALKIAARYVKDPDYNSGLIFCLNATLAAVRSKQAHVVRRRLLVRYLKLVVKCPQYHKDIEGNFWNVQAAVAFEQKNPVAALTMYQWVLELGPNRRQAEIVNGYILKIKDKYPNAVVLYKLMRKDLVETGPRHRK